MDVWIYTLASVFIVSAISLIGVFFLSLRQDRLKKLLLFLVSFAVGGLFGDAFIHLLPESFEKLGTGLMTSLYILFGIILFFIVEKFVRWRHCHDVDCEKHPKHLVAMNLIGDGVHNLIDGMVIGASYLASIPLGVTTTLAVIFHEIPQEIGDFGVLLHGGLSVRKALLFNFLSALTAVLGAVVSLMLGPRIAGYTDVMLPITAGGFIYIAAADLLPELQHEVKISNSLWQLAAIVAGIGIMAVLLFIVG